MTTVWLLFIFVGDRIRDSVARYSSEACNLWGVSLWFAMRPIPWFYGWYNANRWVFPNEVIDWVKDLFGKDEEE